MGDIHWTEVVFVIGTFIVLTSYHLYWIYQVRRSPMQTYAGVSKHLRHAWVQSVITDKRDILSVQSLRNWIMASSFLASTAMLIALGLLSFMFRPEHISELPFDLTQIFSRMKTLFMVKLMVLILHFFFAFFSFTLSIRYMNQVSFMLNVPTECDPRLNAEFISHALDTGMLHYTMGMRAYYLAAVITLWLFGPVWMFLGGIVLVVVLQKLDHCCTVDFVSGHCEVPERNKK